MNFQTRKLIAIEYLIGLKDEKVLRKIETTILEIQNQENQLIKPLTQKQLNARAQRAEKGLSIR